MNNIKKIIYLFAFGLIIISGCKDDDPKPYKQTVALEITHNWMDTILELNKIYTFQYNSRTDTIIPTTLIYHINNLRLRTQDSLTIDADLPYYMVDYEDKAVYPTNISFTTPMEGVKYYVTSLEFTIGVADSLTNVTDALKSTFINPMHWPMIGGYIHFKLDATSPQVPDSVGNTLLYHVGGYKKPYNNTRRVKLTFDKPYLLNKENTLTIVADLYKLFNSANELDIKTINQEEDLNDNSKLIADNIAKIFSFGSLK